MGKPKETFNKKEKEKRKHLQRQDKQRKMEDRKAGKKNGNSLEGMMAYLDENGNLVDTPPDLSKKRTINAEDIQLGVPVREKETADEFKSGKITFFNSSKGFGFITETTTHNRIFFHVNNLSDPVQEFDEVRFRVEKGPRGLNAIQVSKLS